MGRSAAAGLYVHVPFCSGKCAYCAFVSGPQHRALSGRYLDALDREASFHPGFRPETLYVGGGTPSELGVPELERLFGLLAGRFGPLEALREVTVEGNPESLLPDKLSLLRRLGVGRLSIGLQSSDDRLLEGLGRRHRCADFERAYREAERLGFSLSVDVMLGLPGQSLSGALSTLKTVMRLAPGHVSVYCLHVEEGTPLERRGFAADEDLSREMFESSIELLARAGYRHYEISNFARPGLESRHNENYWLNGPYLGLGAAAASHLRGVRCENDPDPASYCAKVERGESPAVQSEALSGKEKAGEDLLLGLRLVAGVPLTSRLRRHFTPELESLRRRGLIELERSPRTGLPLRARLSREGLFLANKVFQEFVPPFETLPSAESVPMGERA
ncbi:MAG TPA: coproporphyrinogen III oxidase [Elusimicrobia bacterium]|nr:coproporphyrinogen III oxidase [Elusimicrobiota bacterium]